MSDSVTIRRKKALAHLGFRQLQFIASLCGTDSIEWLSYHDLSSAIKKTANMQPGQKNYQKSMAARITLHRQRAMTFSNNKK